jgi:UDP:flavonoid glycosyltransferase YjiC (YdhE family)
MAFATRLFEETHEVPAATLHLAPSVFRTVHRQPVHVPGRDLTRYPSWVKRTLWWLIDRIAIDPLIVGELNRFRRELGLRPVARVFDQWLHSPQRVIGLFPEWFGPPQPDWPAQVRLTGFPLFDEADQHAPTPDLDAFIAAGDPPIVFTPGTANRTADAFMRTAVEAAARLRRRALLLTRYPEQVPEPLAPGVRHEAYVPLSRVLPLCAALVHHGGIGTSAQGLAAGTPQLVMPFGFDQPDNAARLEQLGVGTWIVPSQFTPDRVADRLATLLTEARVHERCRRWAAAVAASRAVEDTCDLLEDVAAMPRAAAS